MKKPKQKTQQQLTEKQREKCVLKAKLISKILDGYRCRYCKRTKPEVSIHSHHIYNEGCHKSMSADIDNLFTVCFTHHSSSWNSKEPSFHKNPQEMADWFNETYPELARELRIRSQKSVKCDIIYWNKKEKELDNQLKILNQ